MSNIVFNIYLYWRNIILRVLLVRHTETEANIRGVYGGNKEYKLSLKGLEDIDTVVKEILLRYDGILNKDLMVYTSTLSRCRELANAIQKSIGAKIKEDNRLIEFNFGIFDGFTSNELMDKYKKEYENWGKDYKNYVIPKGESLFQCDERVKSFVNEIIKKNEDTIIVTHGGIIKHIIIKLLNLTLDDYWKFYCGNGALVELVYEEEFGYIRNIVQLT